MSCNQALKLTLVKIICAQVREPYRSSELYNYFNLFSIFTNDNISLE